MEIHEYIEHAFRLIDTSKTKSLLEATNSYYSELTTIAEEYLPQFLVAKVPSPSKLSLQVEVIYAFEKSSRYISIGKKDYVIYNRYLGQTLNNLNKLLVFAADGSETTNILLRLISEELYANGKDFSAKAISQFRKAVYSDDSILTTCASPRVNLRTLIQELFIISHEAIHLWINKYADKEALCATAKAEMSRHLEVFFVDEEMEKSQSFLANIYGRKLELTGLRDGRKHVLKAWESVLPHIDYEEYICDAFSLEFLYYVLDKARPLMLMLDLYLTAEAITNKAISITEEVLSAVYDLIKHIRIFTCIKKYLAIGHQLAVFTEDDLLREHYRLLARTISIKTSFAGNIYDPKSMPDFFKWWDQRDEWEDHYHEILGVPIFDTFSREGNVVVLSNIIRIDLENDRVELIDPKKRS